jgi:hypothetical protein
MMHIEQRTVSRKTPKDGKLEISAATAARLEGLGAHFALESESRRGTASVQSMACTCDKGAGSGHLHYFVESQLLRTLEPGTDVRVEIDDQRPDVVRIEPA